MTFSSRNTERPDVELLAYGDTLPALAGPILRRSGWRGGLFVQMAPAQDPDLFVVERSDGNSAVGFILFASENYDFGGPGSNNNYLSNQVRGNESSAASGASTITIISGGAHCLFKLFETTALTGGGTRTGGAITYSLNESLKVSENGLLCNDSDVNLAAAGVTTPNVVGFCISIPSELNDFRLGLDLKF